MRGVKQPWVLIFWGEEIPGAEGPKTPYRLEHLEPCFPSAAKVALVAHAAKLRRACRESEARCIRRGVDPRLSVAIQSWRSTRITLHPLTPEVATTGILPPWPEPTYPATNDPLPEDPTADDIEKKDQP